METVSLGPRKLPLQCSEICLHLSRLRHLQPQTLDKHEARDRPKRVGISSHGCCCGWCLRARGVGSGVERCTGSGRCAGSRGCGELSLGTNLMAMQWSEATGSGPFIFLSFFWALWI